MVIESIWVADRGSVVSVKAEFEGIDHRDSHDFTINPELYPELQAAVRALEAVLEPIVHQRIRRWLPKDG